MTITESPGCSVNRVARHTMLGSPNPHRTLGILGGMGPAATVLLMQRIIAATPATADHEHIPLLVDNNPRVPSRIEALIHGTGPSPEPVLVAMARRLEQAGAEALVMPCNTAHHYAAAITDACSLPFLNMIDLTARKIAAMVGQNARVGLLASPAVRMIALYEPAFEARGLKPVYAPDDAELLAAIELLKENRDTAPAEQIIGHAAQVLVAAGVDAVVLACTEFSIVHHSIALDIPVVDALDVLVEAALRFATGIER